MNYILISILLLTDIIVYMIFLDIILSWISIFAGKGIRIKFIADILEPMYRWIKKIIPTIVGPFELAPAIVILVMWLIQGLVVAYDMEIILTYKDLFKF